MNLGALKVWNLKLLIYKKITPCNDIVLLHAKEAQMGGCNKAVPQPFLTCINFRGSVKLDGKKITTLFSLTSNRNFAFHFIMNVSSKVIYGFYTSKMFANFNKSHYLELLKLKKGKPKYICLHTAMSFFFKKNGI
jgi:hypothetical protein